MNFEKPKMEVIVFDETDIIVTSDCKGGIIDDCHGLIDDPTIPDGDMYSAGAINSCQPGSN